jgi:LysM repeat protein
MEDFFSTLKGKLGPLPVWAWAGLGTIALALYLMRRKSKSDSNSDSTSAAADQTNSDLSSASELANMFEVAGLMPYQGGDVYVNTTNTPPKSLSGIPASTQPATINKTPAKPTATVKAKQGETFYDIAKKYGVTKNNLWAYNLTKGIQSASAIAKLNAKGINQKIPANTTIYIPPKTWKPT